MITNSTWADVPITLNENLSDPVWAGAGKMAIAGAGFLITKNDAQFLYAALDVVSDTINDSGVGDYFWFTFDRNRDGNISTSFDVNYGQFPSTPDKIGRQFYLAPGTWTGLGTDNTGFKSAFEASPNSDIPHRVWKFKFKLTDLNISLAPFFLPPFTKFGIKIHSTNPPLEVNTPANFWTSFAGLHTLYLSRRPVISPSLMGPVIGCVGLIPSTKINGTTGKATTDAGYMVPAQNAAFGGYLNIIGNEPLLHSLLTDLGAKYLKVFHNEGIGTTATEFRTSWNNYVWTPAINDYKLYAFGPDSGNFYPLQDPTLDYSIHDLLFQFDSSQLNPGIHQFSVKFYNATKGEIKVASQILTLNIDNSIPTVKINKLIHGTKVIDSCCIEAMTGPTDGIVVNFDAWEPNGNLRCYGVSAEWGDNGYADITPETDYSGTGDWNGVQNQNSPASGVWVPKQTCAHALRVWAYSRITNGYGYIGYNSYSKHITIII